MNKYKDLLYIEDFEELFVDIQTKKIFVDQKTFVDCYPKRSLTEINNAYNREKLSGGFNLKTFVTTNFDLPDHPEEKVVSKSFDSVEEYIQCLWDALTRYPETLPESTLIPLPEKFIIPGGRFREIFYWDSYFTMLGLQVAKRIDLIESMVNNFACLINRFGFVPNGNRTYFLSRSQPPFFSMMIELLSEEKGNDTYVKYLSQLEKEYAFWMKDMEKLTTTDNAQKHVIRMKDGEVLNRYWDELNTPRPEGYVDDLHTAELAGKESREICRHIRAGAESGWDFSSRWFKDEKNLYTICTTDIIALDLNCLLLHLEETLSKTYKLKGSNAEAERFDKAAQNRKEAIQKYMWDEASQLFTDFDWKNNKPNRVATVIMVYPLVFKLASQKQAQAVTGKLKERFLQPGGLLTTLNVSGQQWDAPNGWAPLQWMAFKGALNYGEIEFANQLKQNWITNVDAVFKSTGMLMEKYNVVNTMLNAEDGEYPNQYGFGWTNGVYLKLKSINT